VKLEEIEVKKLKFHGKNARKHGDKNKKAIKGSLMRFDQQTPIVIDDQNMVLKGNGTLEALMKLGKKKVWCVRSDLKGEDAEAYALADNRAGELAEWETDVLVETLARLNQQDFDLDAIGFDQKDLKKWLRGMDDVGKDLGANIRQEWLVVVECSSEEHQAHIFEQLQEAGEKCRVL
jgi:ParB-like chromosome segregation protein Spo0J